MKLQYLFKQVYTNLAGYYPSREAKVLTYTIIEHIFGYNRILTHEHFLSNVSSDTQDKINNIVDQLKQYKPIQYILGSCLFYECQLRVAPGVLIPRPETEELVDLILKTNQTREPMVLDIGTGSGCIAIAMAKHLPQAKIFATDISETALNVAGLNARKNNVNVQFIKNDILNPEPFLKSKRFDVVVSNPPYVRNSEKTLMQPNVLNWEPPEALFVSDDKPLVFYQSIIKHARILLKRGGKLFFEVNENMATKVKTLMAQENFSHVQIHKDIQNKNRMVWGSNQSVS